MQTKQICCLLAFRDAYLIKITNNLIVRACTPVTTARGVGGTCTKILAYNPQTT